VLYCTHRLLNHCQWTTLFPGSGKAAANYARPQTFTTLPSPGISNGIKVIIVKTVISNGVTVIRKE
jgi:hypothetical protein